MLFAILPIVLVLVLLALSVRLVNEFERGVMLRFGIYRETKGPGLRFIIPAVDQMFKVDTRVVTLDIPPQDVITKDNVSIKVNAVLYFYVVDPSKAILAVENYLYASSQIAQTTLRSVCGGAELDELLSNREEINHRIQAITDRQTDPWGIKVTMVELKDIDLAQEMRRAMARQAEAERERRAKIIQAEGEFQAAEKLTAAARIMATESSAFQLRYLETLKVISAENNSTIIFPLPMNLIERMLPKN